MNCCSTNPRHTSVLPPSRENDETLLASRELSDGLLQTELSVPTAHCAGCVRAIENGLAKLPGVESARVNLTTRRVRVRWRKDAPVPPMVETLEKIGFPAHLHDAQPDVKDDTYSRLLYALAVAGFASSNIMLLSVSVWSGADSDTRQYFHWISAAIALATLVYSGRIFFVPAWAAVRRGTTNMDVPISIGVLMTYALSLYETIHHGQHAYYDAAVSLLFVLLIGRTLDYRMREQARSAVQGLARLASRGALVLGESGNGTYTPLPQIAPGMTILLAAGERVPVDGTVLDGRSELDCSLLTGESRAVPVQPGSAVLGGTLNIQSPLKMVATARATNSFLAEIVRLVESAETGRAAYRRIADRAARLYAPVVHLTAALSFCGWAFATGDVHKAATVAIAVLIITCPCALGLAVPIVQAFGAKRLFESGILLKDSSALERLVEIDTVIFDKTGTLTLGTPRLVDPGAIDPSALQIAASIAANSRHPYSRAIAAARIHEGAPIPLAGLTEHPGKGMEATLDNGHVYRLGNPAWAVPGQDVSASVVLAMNGTLLAAFAFEDELRPSTSEAIATLRRAGLAVQILSGDQVAPVQELSQSLGVAFRAQVDPAGKIRYVEELQARGHKVLMIGDGINDAPALTAAHASMSPGSAADIGRAAADLVFLHDSIMAVPQALAIARRTDMLVRQNLWISIGYNVVAVPVAILGLVTPLFAAIAMSVSSLTVVANALRLRTPPLAAALRPAEPPVSSEPVALKLSGHANG